ncbi:hypothetical protein [Kribbella shirazensis]|uniref:Uncharacterized protein n=1 Tax=Kribbella shirazensis TaxID=1105143 RepID=A0A7X5VJ01_9ACTN|nr:hypothetical protein [Kribbella shirazensis]NIK61013.1 hypothetical protein [Kribbella shirazensis]
MGDCALTGGRELGPPRGAFGTAPQHEGDAEYAGTTTTLPQATAVGMPLAQPRVQQPPSRTLIASAGSVKLAEQKLRLNTEPPAARSPATVGSGHRVGGCAVSGGRGLG